MTPVGMILAGGQSRRMGGGDKALAELGGAPMLTRVIDRLGPQVDALALNANGDPARFSGFGLPVVTDSVGGFAGPLAGILAAMDWAGAQGREAVVTVAADTPFFPPDLVARLAEVGAPAVVETPDGAQPIFGLWPVALRDDLALALAGGSRKVGLWAEAIGARRVRFAAEAFFNINTPEDLAEARRRMAEETL